MADDFDPAMVTWVNDEESLAHLCEAIGGCYEVIQDLETSSAVNNLDEHSEGAKIVLASLTLPTETNDTPTTWVVPLAHPDSPWLGRWRRTMRRIALSIRDARVPLVNANVKFDSRWVKQHAGVDLSPLIVWDTQVSSHLLDENASTRLKVRAAVTFGIPPWNDFDLSKPGAAERVPLIDLGLYAARDTYWTWRLAELHRKQMYLIDAAEEPESDDDLENARLGKLATWCAMPTTATLAAIEQRGMVIDKDWTSEQLVEHLANAELLFEQMSMLYPHIDQEGASFAPTSNWFRQWAQAAVDSGDLMVSELTPTGKSRWSKGVLVRQARQGSKVAQQLLDYRGHSKKAEFLASWLGYRYEPTSTIHTTYNAGVVATGRLSSSAPNMQQVTAVLKPAFVPRDGFVFADLDFSQIELRVAAFISRSEPMIRAFQRGDDLHKMLAMQITGRQDVTPAERQHAKAGNFGFLYMQSPYGFRHYAEDVYDISFTIEEAVQIHRSFFETWDGIAQWHARTVHQVHQSGQVISPIGRVRRLPQIWDGNEAMVSYAERAAVNSAVQGFASDLMQIAAASIEGVLPGVESVRGARIVATVHDSILVEVPEDNWKVVAGACQERMVNVGEILKRMDCVLDVPLAAEVKVGTRWGLGDVGVLE